VPWQSPAPSRAQISRGDETHPASATRNSIDCSGVEADPRLFVSWHPGLQPSITPTCSPQAASIAISLPVASSRDVASCMCALSDCSSLSDDVAPHRDMEIGMSEEAGQKASARDSRSWISVLERATELKICLLVLSFVLAIDLAAATFGSANLLSLNWKLPNEQLNPGTALIFAACYLLYMSTCAPLAQAVFSDVAYWIRRGIDWFEYQFFTSRHSKVLAQPSPTHVTASSLRDAAIFEQNKFMLDLYEKHESQRSEGESSTRTLVGISFSCLLLVVFEFGLTGTALKELAGTASWPVGGAMALLVGAPWFYSVLKSPPAPPLIYYPPLALKKLEKWRIDQGLISLKKHPENPVRET
jgi:hypothetical protein